MEYSRKSWMSGLCGDLLLRDLSIPGTHDSGTSALGEGPAHTQNFDIERQLNDGIRFLDIRLAYMGKEDSYANLLVFHGDFYCNVDFFHVLNSCVRFLEQNPSETVVMCVKSEHNQQIHQQFRKTIDSPCPNGKNYREYFYVQNDVPSLGAARGKIVLFKRIAFDDFGVDLTAWDDDITFWINNPYQRFRVDDRYNTHNTGKKLAHVINSLTRSAGMPDSLNGMIEDADWQKHLYITFASIAAGSHTPYQYAWGGTGIEPAINSSLIDYFSRNPGGKRWGAVLLDFYNDSGNNRGVNNKLVDAIIESNGITLMN